MKNKKQIKEIKQVIKKYKSTDKLRKFGNLTICTATTLASGLLISDLFLTGGVFTLTAAGIASLGTYTTMSGISGYMAFSKDICTRSNTAGQRIRSAQKIFNTLNSMETRLKVIYHHTVRNPSAFLKFAEEVTEDLNKITPAFNIVSAGPNKFSDTHYEFILGEKITGPGKKELITLQSAIEDIQKESKPRMAPPKPKKPKGGFGL